MNLDHERKIQQRESPERNERREFIHVGASFAAGAGLVGLGSTKLFAANSNSVAQTTIENVTLNNGVQMPILEFGTLYLNDEKGAQCVADMKTIAALDLNKSQFPEWE